MYKNLPPEIIGIILQNTRDGIMISNASNQIEYINQSFTDVTGYSTEEIIGRDPKILQSGRHDAAFYSDMWKILIQTDHWEGEIWDKRKNGEVYLEFLSINAVTNSEGQISHYVAFFSDIQEKYNFGRQLDRAAQFDDLTALPKRSQIIHYLTTCLDSYQSENKLLAVIVIDLDDFKTLNDHHGHALGDRILIIIARRLKRLIRSTDMVGRLGGDEFVLILPALNNMDEVEQMTRRIISLIASSIEIDGHKYHLTTSLGITLFPFDSADAEMLLRHADQAMYQAKDNGKNQHHLFDTKKDQQAQTRRELFQELSHAIEHNELILYYQPKVNMRTGKVIGAEALLRWQHPEKGLLGPGDFLPHVEYHDLIIDIGNWVTYQAMSQLSEWLQQGLELTISINIAARQLLQRDFVDSFCNIIKDFPDVPLKYLELEILESAALENTEHVEHVIKQCQELGVSFALDDFGTGYASLSYLRDIPANILKIDQSFIFNLLDKQKDMTLVEGIIGLAIAFQRAVIAEGIETAEQGVLLMRLGCDLGQGYGIAKPMPACLLADWIKSYQPEKEWAIWSDTLWEMGDFPLLVAQYDHINWVRRVLKCIDGEQSNLEELAINDHHQCRFGHWYYEYGSQRYSHIKVFEEIESIHTDVHKVGRQIVKLCGEENIATARQKGKELLELKDKILDKLLQLQYHIIKQKK
ncbi:MAG: EAL domain-containing protein [gamma proteobacterium symbiont of Taylorina sp.]|nr:EAL domain-containing protein [gamma proteobacterium symbiont of Taylorina sp.]